MIINIINIVTSIIIIIIIIIATKNSTWNIKLLKTPEYPSSL